MIKRPLGIGGVDQNDEGNPETYQLNRSNQQATTVTMTTARFSRNEQKQQCRETGVPPGK